MEDLHWIDKTSEEYFATAVESLPGAPTFLVTTYRPGYRAGSVRRLLAEVALAAADRDTAATHFKNGIDVLRDVEAENELALAYAGYGRLHVPEGNIAEARHYFTQALEIFERLGTLLEPDRVRRDLAELA